VGRAAGLAQGLQIVQAFTHRHRIGYVGDGLGRLADRNGRDDRMGGCIDRREGIGVFQPDIDSGPIARWPYAVRQVADRDCCDLVEGRGIEDEDLVITRRISSWRLLELRNSYSAQPHCRSDDVVGLRVYKRQCKNHGSGGIVSPRAA